MSIIKKYLKNLLEGDTTSILLLPFITLGTGILCAGFTPALLGIVFCIIPLSQYSDSPSFWPLAILTGLTTPILLIIYRMAWALTKKQIAANTASFWIGFLIFSNTLSSIFIKHIELLYLTAAP